MEFKNRKPQNKNRVLITPESGTPFYAMVQRKDNPESGNEGTPLEAGIFEEFNQKVEQSVKDSADALENAENAINMLNNLTVSCTEVDSTANPQVEIKTNAENNHKDIHFILPASKRGKSYRNKGAWSNVEQYVNNDFYIDTISFNGCTYYCKATNSNIQPEDNTESEYWGLLAKRGSNANVTIVDNLESDNASYALSAKQGSVINTKFNNIIAAIEQHSAQISNILNLVYPVGSIYISRNPSNPEDLFGGVWQPLAAGKTLWTTAWDETVTKSLTNNDVINAGLPNIKGKFAIKQDNWNMGSPNGISGAFRGESINLLNNTYTYSDVEFNMAGIDFDAHRCNEIYNDETTTVQPPAFKVYMWERTE